MSKSLNIVTAQNVTIEYPLATVADRIFAFMIDGVILVLIYLVIALVLFIFNAIKLQMIFFGIIFVFYSLILEYFRDGQSWGKQIMGLKVVKINGTDALLSDYIARWIFRLVDIYTSAGAVAMFLINSTTKAQRLGDIVANTAVINIKSSYSPSLTNVINIKTTSEYKPMYPQVLRMTEAEMVEVKSIMQEIKNFPNKTHLQQLTELRNLLCTRLQIKENNMNDQLMIQQLINDYIVLTR